MKIYIDTQKNEQNRAFSSGDVTIHIMSPDGA